MTSPTITVREVPVAVENGTRATSRGEANVYVVAVRRYDYMDDVITFRVRVTSLGHSKITELWLTGRWVEVGRYYGHTTDQAAIQAIRDVTEGIEDEW